jgi:hypothetical protein
MPEASCQARRIAARHRAHSTGLLVLALIVAMPDQQVAAEDATSSTARPAIKSDRWQEDWSPLANPALRTEPLDALKYIPLSPTDPKSYISLGLTLRERFESNNAPSFGVGNVQGDSYLLQRLWGHADVRPSENWQLFATLEDVRPFDKRTITPVDENLLDLRHAFLAYVNTTDMGTFKARVGRQDFAFDLQRFVSLRDGPNVRQSFDAMWADWETGPWRFIGFVSQPVQYRDVTAFDDFSNGHFRFHTLRVERHVLGSNELSAYYSRYELDDAHYLDASGNERRNIFDTRFAGTLNNWDWDLEAMGQTGDVGTKEVRAWAAGARAGYTLANATWKPRVGMQVDAASGDRHPGDNVLGTFNPLFPNGYYFALAGYTGYVNLIHVKPSLTVKPTDKLTLMGAVGLQWRLTDMDAIYVQPNNPVPDTAQQGSRWSGVYGQTRADYVFDANLTGAVEFVQYEVGETIQRAGGHSSTYLGVELKFAW